MSHYLTREEAINRAEALRRRQTEDSAYDIILTLKKDAQGWYADVPTHTRTQNAMVAGSDRLCDRLAEGGNVLTVRFRTVEDPRRTPILKLHRMLHVHGYGAEYLASGLGTIPMPAYICDVGHDVMGEHAEDIYVYGVENGGEVE